MPPPCASGTTRLTDSTLTFPSSAATKSAHEANLSSGLFANAFASADLTDFGSSSGISGETDMTAFAATRMSPIANAEANGMLPTSSSYTIAANAY